MALHGIAKYCLLLLSCVLMSLGHAETTDGTVLHFQESSSFCSSWTNCSQICDLIPYNVFKCPSNHTMSVMTSNCATYNPTEDLLEVGRCLYDYYGSHESIFFYVPLPAVTENLTNFMCKNYGRTGTLCSKCEEGHYPLAYSFDMSCVECSDSESNWWKLVLITFIPLTIFYFVVLLFNITVTSSHFREFVFYSQVVSFPALARVVNIEIKVMRLPNYLHRFLQCFQIFYGVWNLDFFRALDLGICLNTDTMMIIAFDVAVGVYPLLLVVLTYFVISLYDKNFQPLVLIWRPFRAIFSAFHRNWDVRTSLVDSFVTFFALTHMKFISVTYDLLVPVQVYQLDSTGNLTTSWRLFNNASMPFLGATHLPYAILATAVLLVILFPGLLLFLYPFCWFQKLLNLLPFCWYILHTFVDAFQGHYKDGTQPGTRDCRWFASSSCILIVLIFLIGITMNAMFYVLSPMILTVYIILFVNVSPLKDNSYTSVIFFLYLVLLYAIIIALNIVNKITTLILCFNWSDNCIPASSTLFSHCPALDVQPQEVWTGADREISCLEARI